jgi:predicted nucleic acid-binding protein
MSTFCDTSFLCALYGRDVHTAKANLFMAQHGQPLQITQLVDYEFAGGIRHRLFRHAIIRAEANAMEADYAADLEAGLLLLVTTHLSEIVKLAKKITHARTETGGYRSFDILHVASALYLGANTFLTFDQQQKRLAQAEGLEIF